MFLELFSGMDLFQIVILIASAVLIGINKTAIPGVGVLPVIMLTMAFDSRLSTGLQLILLVMADLMAAAWYRRKADWRIVFSLLPWAWAGLFIGMVILWKLPADDDRLMRVLIGGIVLALAVVNFVRLRVAPEKVHTGPAARGFFGTLLGITTHLAKAAGPVAAIYFLAMKLPKQKYMGCNAWFFLILNWTKLPIFIAEGRITAQSLWIDLCMIPFLLLGGALGVVILAKMPQKIFENVIQIIVVVCCLILITGLDRQLQMLGRALLNGL